MTMTPDEIRDARGTLGRMWGKDRPLSAAELARALGLSGIAPGRSVRRWETGERAIQPTAAVLIRAYLGGAEPPAGVFPRRLGNGKHRLTPAPRAS